VKINELEFVFFFSNQKRIHTLN